MWDNQCLCCPRNKIVLLLFYCIVFIVHSCVRAGVALARLQMTFQLHEDSSLQIESFAVKKLNGVFVKL